MYRKISFLTSIFVALMVGLSGLALAKFQAPLEHINTNQDNQTLFTKAIPNPQDRVDLLAFLDASNKLFEIASTSLENKQPLESADYFQTGLNLLSIGLPEEKMTPTLKKAVDSLHFLAVSLEKGRVNSVDDLRSAVGKFNLSVSRYYLFQAETAWKEANQHLEGYDLEIAAGGYEDRKQMSINATGYNLQIAVQTFENGVQWIHYTDPKLTQVIDNGYALAAKLIIGKGYKGAAVADYLNTLNHSLEPYQMSPSVLYE